MPCAASIPRMSSGLVSVRQSDGVTVIGTTYFTPDADSDQLNKDFTSMINSMLRSQAAGG